jgi:26S proteasome regulatory subunit T2
MGQGQSGGLPKQNPGGDRNKGDGAKKEKKYEPAAPPTRVGRKQRKQKGSEAAARLPVVTPATKCKLRLLKLDRVKDYLLMEEEFVANQERLKPQEDKNEEDRSKVDDLRGSPMSVGNLEEIIDENHAIVSSSVGPEYYVNILSFVDKDQLEPGCAILMHNKVQSLKIHHRLTCPSNPLNISWVCKVKHYLGFRFFGDATVFFCGFWARISLP